MDYKKAIAELNRERSARLADARLLYIDLLKRDNEFYEVEKALRSLKLNEALGKETDKALLNSLLKRRSELLFNNGVTTEMLDPPYKCEKCRDTGLVGDKPCSCIIKKCSSADESNTGASFDKSDLSIFPESRIKRISVIYDTMKAFCLKFPSTNKKSIILMGKCGTGKSYLASCMANAVSDNGYSAIMLSAFAFNNRMLKYHTTFDGEKLGFIEPLLDCDLLIIDDLGSEQIIKNVTVEYLFHIVNERLSANKHIIITTNLDSDMIKSRYGERTHSRLFASSGAWFSLSDTDLRK